MSEETTATAVEEPTADLIEVTSKDGSEKYQIPRDVYADMNESRIDELTRMQESNDETQRAEGHKRMQALGDWLERLGNVELAEISGEALKAPATETAPQSTQPREPGDEEAFWLNYNGQRIKYDDKNKLLGYENTGQLKAALLKERLMAQERTQSLEERLRQAEQRIQEFNTSPATPQTPPPHEPPSQQPVVEKVERPTLPRRPTVPIDSSEWTEDDAQKMDAYYRARDEYDEKMHEYLAHIESRPVRTEMPPEMKSQLDEIRQVSEQMKRNHQAEENARLDRAHWRRFEDFQDAHKEVFATPKPIKQLRDDVVQWMDTIAITNGVHTPAPNTPRNDPAWQNYASQRSSVVQRYLDGDATVRDNAQGFPPPEGSDVYFRLAEVESARQNYVAQGRLGAGASLEDAYLLHSRESGNLQEAYGSVANAGEEAGRKQVISALEEHGRSAATIPPEESAPAPSDNQLGISESDLNWFKSIREEQYASLDREGLARYHGIADRIQQRFGRI